MSSDRKICPYCGCSIPKTDIENCNTCGVPFEQEVPLETEVETDDKP